MARDHALALGLEGGRGVLRLYRWAEPTVSFGRNEPVRGPWDLERARGLGLSFVRRPTGGRAVLHDRELTYAVAAPCRSLAGARAFYRAVNAGLVRALRSLGAAAELAPPSTAAPAPGAGPCFRRAAPGEVVVRGRKLVGSAQARVRGALLQHGSLLLAPGQDLLEEVGPARREGDAAPASLVGVLGFVPPWEALVDAVVDGLAAELEGEWSPPEPPGRRSPDPELEARLLARYGSGAWTWRR